MTIFTPGSVLDPAILRAIIDAEFARVWAAIGQEQQTPQARFVSQPGVGAATTFQIPAGYVIGQNTCYVPYNITPGALTLNWGLTLGGGEVAVTKAAYGAPSILLTISPLAMAPNNSGAAFTLYVDGTWNGATADILVHLLPLPQ